MYGQQKNNHHTNNFPTCFIEDYINVFHFFEFFNNLIFNFENVKLKNLLVLIFLKILGMKKLVQFWFSQILDVEVPYGANYFLTKKYNGFLLWRTFAISHIHKCIKHVTCKNQNINVARTMDQGTTNDHFPNHMVSSSSFENNVIINFLKVQRVTK